MEEEEILTTPDIFIKEEPEESQYEGARGEGSIMEIASRAAIKEEIQGGIAVKEERGFWERDSDEDEEPERKVFADDLERGEVEDEGDASPTGDNDDSTQKKLVCNLCGRKYRCLSSLRGHLSKQHRLAESGYTCHLCGAVGSTRAAFKRHLIRTHGPESLSIQQFLTKCRHCGEGLTTLPLLYQHIRTAHPEVLFQYHLCHLCPILATTRGGLSRHYKRRHEGEQPPPLEPLQCTDCEAVLRNPAALRKHVQTHHPPQAETSSGSPGFQCDQCPALFTYRSYLARHIKKVHESCPRPQRYKCSECGREYRHKKRLQHHIATIHASPNYRPVYSCTTCGLTFTTYARRRSHQRKVHRDRSLWPCGECHRSFPTLAELDLHRHSRHKSACPVCGKVFMRRDSLREHLLIHNGPRLPCPHCPKTFTQGSNLKRHIRIHTGEKPYECSFCHKAFGDRSACKSHMLVHTGAGRCTCPTCGATFSKRQKLNYHMRLHTGQGLLYCPLCSRPATNTYDLKKHLETHQMALLTTLKGSLTYAELEDLPDLALKALHNLVWVAVQNSQREKVVKRGGELIENSNRELRGRDLDEAEGNESVSDGMERIDFSCVSLVAMDNQDNCKFDEPVPILKLPKNSKKKPTESLRQIRKNNLNTSSDSQFSRDIVDLELEDKEEIGNSRELDSADKQQNNSDCYEFVSDGEHSEDDSERRHPIAPLNIKRPRKSQPHKIIRKADGDSEFVVEKNNWGSESNLPNELIQEKQVQEKVDAINIIDSSDKNDRIESNYDKPQSTDEETYELSMHNNHINSKYQAPAKKNNSRINKSRALANQLQSQAGKGASKSNGSQSLPPLAVLTEVMQFIMGGLSASNANDTDNADSKAPPTLGDQLVERCLEVIMKDGDNEDDDGSGVYDMKGEIGEEVDIVKPKVSKGKRRGKDSDTNNVNAAGTNVTKAKAKQKGKRRKGDGSGEEIDNIKLRANQKEKGSTGTKECKIQDGSEMESDENGESGGEVDNIKARANSDSKGSGSEKESDNENEEMDERADCRDRRREGDSEIESIYDTEGDEEEGVSGKEMEKSEGEENKECRREKKGGTKVRECNSSLGARNSDGNEAVVNSKEEVSEAEGRKGRRRSGNKGKRRYKDDSDVDEEVNADNEEGESDKGGSARRKSTTQAKRRYKDDSEEVEEDNEESEANEGRSGRRRRTTQAKRRYKDDSDDYEEEDLENEESEADEGRSGRKRRRSFTQAKRRYKDDSDDEDEESEANEGRSGRRRTCTRKVKTRYKDDSDDYDEGEENIESSEVDENSDESEGRRRYKTRRRRLDFDSEEDGENEGKRKYKFRRRAEEEETKTRNARKRTRNPSHTSAESESDEDSEMEEEGKRTRRERAKRNVSYSDKDSDIERECKITRREEEDSDLEEVCKQTRREKARMNFINRSIVSDDEDEENSETENHSARSEAKSNSDKSEAESHDARSEAEENSARSEAESDDGKKLPEGENRDRIWDGTSKTDGLRREGIVGGIGVEK